MKCTWYADFEGVCTNGECPYRGDTCPTSEHPEVCLYSESEFGISELVQILRCCAKDDYVCDECPANCGENTCEDKGAKRQAADMLEKLAAEKDAQKPERIEQQQTAIETCRQLKKSLLGKENVINDELVRTVLQLKSGRCEDRGGAEKEEER